MWWHKNLLTTVDVADSTLEYRRRSRSSYADSLEGPQSPSRQASLGTPPADASSIPPLFGRTSPTELSFTEDISEVEVAGRGGSVPAEALRRTRLYNLWQATNYKMPRHEAAYFRTNRSKKECRLPAAILADRSTDTMLVPVLPLSCPVLQQEQEARRARYLPHEVSFVTQKDLEYYEAFREACRRKYGSLIRAWRLLLDPGGNGRVSYLIFCSAARSIGYREVNRLWTLMECSKTGYCTLDEWDPVAFRQLHELRSICFREYGGMDLAFKFGMDRHGSATCSRHEFKQFCDDMDFTGRVDVLFHALDLNQRGFLTADELDFLQKWEGMRFSKDKLPFDFGVAKLQKMQEHKKLRERIKAAHTSHEAVI